MLAAELAFVHAAVPQAGPQEGFRVGGVLAELAGEFNEGETFAGDLVADFFQSSQHMGTTPKEGESVKVALGRPSPCLSPKVAVDQRSLGRGEGIRVGSL